MFNLGVFVEMSLVVVLACASFLEVGGPIPHLHNYCTKQNLMFKKPEGWIQINGKFMGLVGS